MQAPGDLKRRDGRSACLAEGNGQPIQGAMGSPWVFGADPGSAACRGGVCRESIAVGDWRKSGSSGRRLMDSVVAPYHRELALEQLVDTNAECIRGMSLIEQTRDSDCSLSWA